MSTTNPDHYIIDVNVSLRLDILCFWSTKPSRSTYRFDDAQRVPESVLAQHLDLYDNGDATLSVLCDRVHKYEGDPMDFIKTPTLTKKGATSWLSQRFQKVI